MRRALALGKKRRHHERSAASTIVERKGDHTSARLAHLLLDVNVCIRQTVEFGKRYKRA
jgi:hypothetical protein